MSTDYSIEIAFTALTLTGIWTISPSCNDGYPCLLNTTPSCTLPSILVETDPATNILAHGSTLNGDLTDIGVSTLVDVYFEYGIATGVYTYTTAVQVVSAIGVFHEDITHLQNNTTYYFRAVADNGTTIVYGIEREFTTISPTSPYKTIVAGIPNTLLASSLKQPIIITLALTPETVVLKANTRT